MPHLRRHRTPRTKLPHPIGVRTNINRKLPPRQIPTAGPSPHTPTASLNRTAHHISTAIHNPRPIQQLLNFAFPAHFSTRLLVPPNLHLSTFLIHSNRLEPLSNDPIFLQLLKDICICRPECPSDA